MLFELFDENAWRKKLINSEANETNWAILGDRAYIGPDTDTPNLRRVKMIKNANFQTEINRNTELEKIRVPVWKIKKLVELYKLDRFDEHFEITNKRAYKSIFYKVHLQMRRAQL